METSHTIEVSNLDTEHRRVLEDVIGTQLKRNQRLLISVTDIDAASTPAASGRSAQSLSDWTGVYNGLTDEQIETIDRDVKTRSDLSRHLP